MLKKRFSQFACEFFCTQEYAGDLKQALDDEAEAVVAQGEALVLQQSGVAALDRPAFAAQARPFWLAPLVSPVTL